MSVLACRLRGARHNPPAPHRGTTHAYGHLPSCSYIEVLREPPWVFYGADTDFDQELNQRPFVLLVRRVADENGNGHRKAAEGVNRDR